MKRATALLAFTMVIGAFASTAGASVPDLIPVQGVLADDVGDPVDGMVDLTFALYDASSAGTQLWTEAYTDVDIEEGFFTIYLGSETTLDFASLISNSEIWLGITVGTDPEMDRIRLAAVPFAVEAQVCDQLGSLTEADINSNFMSSSYVPDWSELTSIPTDIADGDDGFTTESELTALLDDNYLASSYVPDWSTITNIPSDIADGDDDTTYTAGNGLVLNSSNVFRADWEGSGGDLGSAITVARSDHAHDGDYAPLSHNHDADYIQNQSASAQVADMNIAGSAEVGSLVVNGNVNIEGGVGRITSCPSGTTKVENNLCVEDSPRSSVLYWSEAVSICRRNGRHLCTYAEWDQILCHVNDSAVVMNPYEQWVGDYVADNTVTCGNVDITTSGCKQHLVGDCSKAYSAKRDYHCCLSFGGAQ